MVRQYSNDDIDAVMQIWLDTNIRAHHFIPSDYWRTNCDMVRELLSHAEIYVHEDECAKQIDGFIGLNDDYIEGIFVKETMQSKGIGKIGSLEMISNKRIGYICTRQRRNSRRGKAL